MASPRGIFISFEGPEGSGKSTQAAELTRRLEAAGRTVMQVREPGGTRTGEAIRDILQHDKAGEAICRETEVLLFAASRAQLVRQRILPALAAAQCVVCDRFADSTTAYQGYGRGLPIEQMISINEFAIDGARPDLTLLLDIDLGTLRERMAMRHRQTGAALDRIEREAESFHRRVREGYLELAGRYPDRFVTIDGAAAVAAIADRVWIHVEPLLEG